MEHNIVASLRSRDRRVLGRAVSIAENGGERASNLVQRLKSVPSHSSLIGFTGTPGSGKSTLLDALVSEFRRRGFTVAIIAIDPSSPFSGGAVLGDRCRMGRHHGDDGVYIRSLSARGSVGGLSVGVRRVVEVLRVAGFDLILLETVGTGQSEIDVIDLVDVCAVICTPNSGDDIQAIKSGILEIADILVANKSDLTDANGTVPQLIMAQNLRPQSRKVPIVPTVATEGKGIDRLADELLERCAAAGLPKEVQDRQQIKKHLVRRIARVLEERLLHQETEGIDQICASIQQEKIDYDEAVNRWFDHNMLRR